MLLDYSLFESDFFARKSRSLKKAAKIKMITRMLCDGQLLMSISHYGAKAIIIIGMHGMSLI